jgi:uncharacterized protein
MKTALIGASGFVGSALLKEALNRGHEVTAIVRHPDKVTQTHPQLTVQQADVLNEEQLASILNGHQAVISAFNAGWDNPRLYDDFLKGARSIQQSVKKSGVKRLITVGGAGSLYVTPGLQLVDSPQFPAEWKPGATAARDYLNELRQETELDWTFVSPAIEMHQGTSGKRRGTYRTGLEEPVFDENGRSVSSVEDLALAILDELEQPRHIRQRFTVAY